MGLPQQHIYFLAESLRQILAVGSDAHLRAQGKNSDLWRFTTS